MPIRKIGLFVAILAIVALPKFSLGKRIHSFAGPYRVLGRMASNVSNVYDSAGKIIVRMRFTPPSIRTTQYVWGESYNAVPMDDNVDADVYISSWSNNQWKQNAFILKFPGACSAGMKHAKSIMTYLFGEDGRKCPIPAGHRETFNQTFNPVFPQFPTFPYGRWLFNLVLRKKKTILGVIAIDGEAVPKL